MAKLSPESLARLRATREQKRAVEPLVVVAKALKTKPETLRARLYYHGQKIKGATVPDLIDAIEKHTRTKLPRAVLKLRGEARAPPVLNNPRQARKPPTDAFDDHVGRIALQRAVNLTCEKIGTGVYDERDLSILGAGLRMLPQKKH
jgi:hypothetical protein